MALVQFPVCTKCKRVFPLENFLAKGSGTRYARCLECRREKSAADFQRRSATRMERSDALAQVIHALGGRCQRCGYDEFLSALAFRKRITSQGNYVPFYDILRRYINSPSEKNWQALQKEGRACGLFCANCLAALEAGEWEYREEG